MPRKIEVPEELAGFLKNRRWRDAIELLNALSEMESHLVPAGGTVSISPGKSKILGDAPSLIFPIPLQFSRGIDNANGTLADVNTKLNLLLTELRKTHQNPG